MQRRYNLAYFIIASIVGLGFMSLMISVDAQAQIAFVSNRDGHSWEIYVMDVDGGNPQRLTNSPEVEWSPSWSPNGKRIVFSAEKDEHEWKQDIYVMDADGGNLQKLTKNPGIDNHPAWSPNGERIIFSSSRGHNNWWETDIQVMDADGGNPQNLTNNLEGDDSPAWFHPALSVSPAGKKLTMWGWLKQVVR